MVHSVSVSSLMGEGLATEEHSAEKRPAFLSYISGMNNIWNEPSI